MANTDKQGFRYPKAEWSEAVRKTEEMRRAGYQIDMTEYLVGAVDQFRNETIEQTAERLGLVSAGHPVSINRRPAPRVTA